ncbi:MAG: hypothetical protein AAGD06_33260, partial [Acidobacteriota bacterium]
PTAIEGLGTPFSGLGSHALTYPFTNLGDVLVPTPAAAAMLGSPVGHAAIGKDDGAYQAAFWAVPFEALPAAARDDAMGIFLEWCDAGPGAIFRDGFESGTTSSWSQVMGEP